MPIALVTLTEDDLWGSKAVSYSRLKLGDPVMIERCAARMERVIRSLAARDPLCGMQYVSHVPTAVHENAIHDVAKRVGARLKFPLVDIKKLAPTLLYRSGRLAVRLRRIPGNVFTVRRRLPAGSTVFLLDDADVTGEMLKAAGAVLGSGRGVRVVPVVAVRLAVRHPEYEFLMNVALYLEHGVSAVLRLVRQSRYRVTGALIMLLGDMLPEDRDFLIARMPRRLRQTLRRIVRAFPRSTPLGRSPLRKLL